MFCPDCGRNNEEPAVMCIQCGAPMPWRPMGPGTRIGMGRYTVLQSLKSGAMGALYLVRDEKFARVCALKEMLEDPHDAGYREMRFLEEAKILAQLHHPQLPVVFDYFRDHDVNYLVMQYVEGEDLETVINRLGPPGIPEETVRGWALQGLDILEYLHGGRTPVVHRDIKPANLILRKADERIVLVDFGIARAPRTGSSGTAVGTVGYAPLEQYQGRAEPRSDLYALGATLLHFLTGLPPVPFHMPPLETIAPHVSRPMQAVIRRAMAREPRDRYPSARAMREAVEAAARKPVKVLSVPVLSARAVSAPAKLPAAPAQAGPARGALVLVPAGKFVMGSSTDDVEERPEHVVSLPDFFIERCPVTIEDFAAFVDATGYVTDAERVRSRFTWRRPRVFMGEMERMRDHPVVYVTHADALAYCAWAGKRLPTEAEWEKAARGEDGRRFPWGGTWDPECCNWGDSGVCDRYRGTAPVEHFTRGASPYGALDMVGNVWEWTSSAFRPYRYDAMDGRESGGPEELRVLRGNSYNMDYPEALRASIRLGEHPRRWRFDYGFRCAADAAR